MKTYQTLNGKEVREASYVALSIVIATVGLCFLFLVEHDLADTVLLVIIALVWISNSVSKRIQQLETQELKGK